VKTIMPTINSATLRTTNGTLSIMFSPLTIEPSSRLFLLGIDRPMHTSRRKPLITSPFPRAFSLTTHQEEVRHGWLEKARQGDRRSWGAESFSSGVRRVLQGGEGRASIAER
jgi:hypothetical protein